MGIKEVPSQREGPAVIKHLLCTDSVLTDLEELPHPRKVGSQWAWRRSLNFLVFYCFITNNLWASWAKGHKTMIIAMIMIEGGPAYLPFPCFHICCHKQERWLQLWLVLCRRVELIFSLFPAITSRLYFLLLLLLHPIPISVGCDYQEKWLKVPHQLSGRRGGLRIVWGRGHWTMNNNS